MNIEIYEENTGQSGVVNIGQGDYVPNTKTLTIPFYVMTGTAAQITNVYDIKLVLDSSYAEEFSGDLDKNLDQIIFQDIDLDNYYYLEFKADLTAYMLDEGSGNLISYSSTQEVSIDIATPAANIYKGVSGATLKYTDGNRKIYFEFDDVQDMWQYRNGYITFNSESELIVVQDEISPIFCFDGIEASDGSAVNIDSSIDLESTETSQTYDIYKEIAKKNYIKYQQWYANVRFELKYHGDVINEQGPVTIPLNNFQRNFVIWVRDTNTGEFLKGKNFFYNTNNWDEMDNVFDMGVEKVQLTGNPIKVNDVSSNRQSMDVQLSSSTITDFNGVEVIRTGKNLLNGIEDMCLHSTNTTYQNYSINNNTITITGKVIMGIKMPVYKGQTYIVSFGYTSLEGDDTTSPFHFRFGEYAEEPSALNTTVSTSVINMPRTADKKRFYYTFTAADNTNWVTVGFYTGVRSLKITNMQVELSNTLPTDYEGYKVQKATANNEGKVEGLTPLSPDMVLSCYDDGVNINLSYYKDVNS